MPLAASSIAFSPSILSLFVASVRSFRYAFAAARVFLFDLIFHTTKMKRLQHITPITMTPPINPPDMPLVFAAIDDAVVEFKWGSARVRVTKSRWNQLKDYFLFSRMHHSQKVDFSLTLRRCWHRLSRFFFEDVCESGFKLKSWFGCIAFSQEPFSLLPRGRWERRHSYSNRS